MLYTLSNIKKTYERKKILDIDFLEIDKGIIYGLLGPNGAGKTTLLKILAFLDSPTSGKILYNNSKIKFTEKKLQILRKKVVLLNQHPILFTTTVYKNIEFGLKIRNIQKKERDKIIRESLELVGMNDFIEAPANKLSGGETQRVALARILAISPDVLLCDEPTSNIDVTNQEVVMDILKKINAQKRISIIFTIHNRIQAKSLANQILFLDHGKIIEPDFKN